MENSHAAIEAVEAVVGKDVADGLDFSGRTKTVVTHSLSSAIAIDRMSGYASGYRAVPAHDAGKVRKVAEVLTAAGCDVVIVPDNSDLSRAVARDAARATGAAIASPVYKPNQPNLLITFADAIESAKERLPLWDGKGDPAGTLANASLLSSAAKAAYVDLVVAPIADAKPWKPGMGRVDRIAEVRAMSAGIER